jgi:hypothetical protein
MVRETLAKQLIKAEPNLTDRQVRIKVFRHLYTSDQNVQQLLGIAWDESFKE